MPGRRITFPLALATLLLFALLGGCSSSGAGLTSPPLDMAGTYASTAAVDGLGALTLTLKPSQYASRFSATLSASAGAIGEYKGTASIGNTHLVLNLQNGKHEPNYYFFFDGEVTVVDGAITRIDGQFVYPDHAAAVPASFSPR